MEFLKVDPEIAVTEASSEISVASEEPKLPDAVLEEIKQHGLTQTVDGFLRWANKNPKHPRNWTLGTKIFNTVVILLLELVTSGIGTAGTAAAHEAQEDHNISLGFSIFCLSSTYLIGQGIGGIFFPPYSEVFGRKPLYIVSTIGYCGLSAVVASVNILPIVIVARFITGVLSAIPTVVVAGSIEDMFNIEARVWMIFVWALVGNLAVCIGPIFSAYVTFSIGWRWVFYMATIGLGVLSVFCFFLKESRPSLLLEREVAELKKKFPDTPLKTLNPDSVPDLSTLVNVILFRPVRLLFTEFIVIVVAAMGSITAILFYLSSESLLMIFQAYGWSAQTASLSFIPILFGCFLGFFTRLYDHRYLAKRTKAGKTLEPEHKLLGLTLAAPALTVGLWIFAWTTPPATQVHWIVPMLSLVLVGYALNENLYTLSGYLADSYTIYAASAYAGLILTRASSCAILLPFANQIYTGLGYNEATSILAGIATVFCSVPFIFRKYGKRIREASKFASLSLSTYRLNMVEDDMNVKA